MERKTSENDFVEIESMRNEYEAMGEMLDNQVIMSDDNIKEKSKESLRHVTKWYRNQWTSNLLGGLGFILLLCGDKTFFPGGVMVALIVILMFKAVFYFVVERILAGVRVMNRDMVSSARKINRIKRLSIIGDIVSYALFIPLIILLSLQFHLNTWGDIILSVTVLVLAVIAVKETFLRNKHLDEIINSPDAGEVK